MTKRQPIICNKEIEITEMHVKINEVHRALMGNGREGLLAQFSEYKGAISVFKWIGASGGMAGVVALIITLLNNIL